MLINDKIYKQLRQQLLSSLKPVEAGDYGLVKFNTQDLVPGTEDAKDTAIAICKKIAESTVPRLGAKKRSKSSALAPRAGTIWAIGGFGSIWLDIEVAGSLWRVAFNPNGGTFHVDLVS
jgi:hypothetical protein